MDQREAEQTLRAAVSRGRHGERFAHDEDAGIPSLDGPRR